ncbi:glycosyltransferase [Maribacter litopenaei]|uniref:Glycosyltransferase n=1 Tax=Maribacter litopenaei TaxID=2976127 RepID=A0ABY5YBF9_9FLAO|nr:glycosyltransferase [Maribacter litopenaei]UWX56382.1 glycosyltransferase [Maribacter litopenaei]
MNLSFSFIIPVFNRPNEIEELLESLLLQTYSKRFEVVIVEDGSTIPAKEVVNRFTDQLNISYYQKPNSGPGDSRNYGMKLAKGNYFVVLDSDCIVPPQYLEQAENSLSKEFVHCYGGPDAAHSSFTNVQKAINYAMTSFLTTGGIRGKRNSVNKFQPRSFNMGISKEAFERTGGYGNIHPGEDPDLTIRIWEKGYDTKLIPEAFVYHKRRIDWNKFYIQVKKFGPVRPILNTWHPKTAKLTYWFPSIFVTAFMVSIALAFLGVIAPLICFFLYFLVLLLDALYKTKKINVAFMSVFATLVQFLGYGFGFLKSTIYTTFSSKTREELFPKLFFKTKDKS